MLIFLAALTLFISLVPYLVYFLGIHLGKRPDTILPITDYPFISIVISAYNEERVIGQRIRNIRESHYPAQRYELIIVDDCSSDDTRRLAKMYLEQSGADYQVIENQERRGTTRSYNSAVERAKYPVVVTTDADVFFEPYALDHLIGRLLSDPRIAAVTGELRPLEDNGSTTALESVYRSFYGRMCEWESAHDSTYNFNGALVAFRSDLIGRINDRHGADDANTAFEAIRRGYRAVYESSAVVYEEVPKSFRVQYRQKTRRATGLIEATLSNLDLLGRRSWFCTFFYPMRILMYIISPVLFLVSAILVFWAIASFNPVLSLFLIILLLIAGLYRRGNLLSAFVLNQIYLAGGLLNLGKDMRIWESTSEKNRNR